MLSAVALDDRERLHVEDRAQWRTWLAEHHADSPGVWVVTWKPSTGRPHPTYEDVIEEALCFGWVDSQGRRLDDERSMLYMAPRKRGGTWAGTNKARVARLEAAGLMAPAGRAAIDRAKEDGSWTLLDDVERLVVPADLAAAFAAHPGSREQWDGFTPSSRQMMLGWIALAKRPATRAQRVLAVAQAAQRGERAQG